jgi:hypothetical protein
VCVLGHPLCSSVLRAPAAHTSGTGFLRGGEARSSLECVLTRQTTRSPQSPSTIQEPRSQSIRNPISFTGAAGARLQAKAAGFPIDSTSKGAEERGDKSSTKQQRRADRSSLFQTTASQPACPSACLPACLWTAPWRHHLPPSDGASVPAPAAATEAVAGGASRQPQHECSPAHRWHAPPPRRACASSTCHRPRGNGCRTSSSSSFQSWCVGWGWWAGVVPIDRSKLCVVPSTTPRLTRSHPSPPHTQPPPAQPPPPPSSSHPTTAHHQGDRRYGVPQHPRATMTR